LEVTFGQEQTMRERVVVRYSQCFKQEVIGALETGRFSSVEAARVHFGIKGAGTIGKWLKRFGRKDLQAKVVRVEKPDEADRIRELQKHVAQLQRALGQTQAQSLLHEEFLKRACELLGQEVEAFKKKNGGPSCTGLPEGNRSGL
jgi:transposase-like protein